MFLEKVLIFDTTLRDGEQSPGAMLKPHEKVEIALALEELGVDVIEAGFPVSSPGDFQAIKTISKKVREPIVCALARAAEKDIKIAWESIKLAQKPRIHTFIGVSDIFLEYQLKKDREEVLNIVAQRVKQAKSYTHDVQIGLMDATRSQFEFLCKVLTVALKAGATTLDIADTVGYSLPWEIKRLIRKIKKTVKGINKATVSIHCHNDLGLATANTLEAVKAGARQIECAINGIGERAGNASLEEIVMLLKTRQRQLRLVTNIRTEKIYSMSRLVSKLMHLPIQPNKAIVGRNAFAHASGIHQDGYLKKRGVIEIMRPQDIGLKSSRIVLGARSGKHALKYRLGLLRVYPSEEMLETIYKKFLQVAGKKRIVTNKDLHAIIKEK